MKRALKILIPILLVAVLLVGGVWYLLHYNRDLTSSWLISLADNAVANERYSTAVHYYEMAYELEEKSPEVALQISDCYKQAGNYTKAEYTLVKAIADKPTTELYLQLSRLYLEQDKILDAVNMLDQISDPDIRAELEEMRPAAPTASRDPGFYTNYITVSISCEEGTLYCTASNTYPSIESDQYQGDIPLELGETTISAVAVSDNGLASPLARFGYTVGGVIEPVTISDSALDAAIREVLGKDAEDELLTQDLWSITEFTVPEEAVDLSALGHCSSMTKLTIQNQVSPDLSFLAKLTALQELDLSGSTLSSDALEAVGTLSALTTLNLSDCGLSTVAPLSGCTALTVLDLSNNSVGDISALASCTGLQELRMPSNALSDASQLAKLQNLTILDVSYNALYSMDAITGCVKLTELDVSGNHLTSLPNMSSLSGLTTFKAAKNELADISVLSSCTSLKVVDLSNNVLVDIDVLGPITTIENLNVSYNDIEELPDFPDDCNLHRIDASHNFLTDIAGLTNLESLNYVILDYNNIYEVESLATCYNLVQVDIFVTNVTDFSALTDMDIIVNYNPR